jgi:hypothetical protein
MSGVMKAEHEQPQGHERADDAHVLGRLLVEAEGRRFGLDEHEERQHEAG